MLKEIISLLVIILLVLFITNYFFNYNPISEIKDKIEKVKYERSLNTTEVDNQILKIDNPPFSYDRFEGITYDGMTYEEDENNDFLVIDFTDNSGYLNNKCFSLIRRTFTNNTQICRECSDKPKGKIYCSIYDYLNNPEKGTLIGTLYATGGGGSGGLWNLNSFTINKDILMNMIIENAEKKCKEGIEGYCNMLEELENKS